MEDRKEESQKQISQRKIRKKEVQTGVDIQGKWLKKYRKLYYRYKKHIGGDKNRMILARDSLVANEYDSRWLNPLITKLGYKSREICAEKDYQVPANVSYFHSRGIKDRVQKKAL
ncbi:MAG: hypothetical protein ACMUEL_07240 [Flavobacteriales bacterium Tduv]